VLAHLADRADIFGWCVAAWIFYMVFDAYTTAKARMLGQPIPDHLGLNALLASFGLGTAATTAAPPAAAAASSRPAGVSAEANPSAGAGLVPLDPALGSAAADPIAQKACTPGFGGMPIGAIILIALGVLLLLDNLGVLSFHWMNEFWPIVLIALGLWMAVRRMGATPGRT
jgi:hypothetical protein